jgi:hypothetical protein
MARRAKSAAGSFDSLLDTMSNVIGILIMTLAVTQLDVESSIKRIRYQGEEVPQVSSAEVHSAGERVEDLGIEREQLDRQYKAIIEGGVLDREKLKKREQIAKLLERNLELHRSESSLDGQIDEKKRNTRQRELEALAQTVLLKRRELTTLQQKIQETLQDSDRLRQQKQSLDLMKSPEISLRLPNPRTPPAGSSVVTFYCRYGRVYPLNQESINQNVFSMIPHQGGVVVRVEDRTAGESRTRIAAADSAFRLLLERHSPADNYVKFLVWSDSFSTYIDARDIAESKDFAVSWVALSGSQELLMGGTGGRRHRTMLD